MEIVEINVATIIIIYEFDQNSCLIKHGGLNSPGIESAANVLYFTVGFFKNS